MPGEISNDHVASNVQNSLEKYTHNYFSKFDGDNNDNDDKSATENN